MTRQERIAQLRAQRDAINDELLALAYGQEPPQEEPQEEDDEQRRRRREEPPLKDPETGENEFPHNDPPQAPPMQFRTRHYTLPKHSSYTQGVEVQQPPQNDAATRRPVGAEVTGQERDANGLAIPGLTDPRFY